MERIKVGNLNLYVEEKGMERIEKLIKELEKKIETRLTPFKKALQEEKEKLKGKYSNIKHLVKDVGKKVETQKGFGRHYAQEDLLVVFFNYDLKIKLDPLLPINDEELTQIKERLNNEVEIYVLKGLDEALEEKISSLIIKYYHKWEKLKKIEKDLQTKKEKVLEETIKGILKKKSNHKIKEYNSKNIVVFF